MPPKAGHQRAKNIDYDDDDGYSDEDIYEEEGGAADGMTDDDREQLRLGTIQVREALGSSVAATDAQIQESLWHYYYDVAKTVSYLKNKLDPKEQPPPKQQEKATSRFEQAASAAGANAPSGKQSQCNVYAESTCPPSKLLQGLGNIFPQSASPPPERLADSISANMADFFWDAPWGRIPTHRLTTMTMISTPRVGGLLGGSKLAQLAAKRKQKQESAAASSETPPKPDTDKAIALLDRLSVKSTTVTPATRSGNDAARKPLSRYTRKRSPSPKPVAEPELEEEAAPEPMKPLVEFPNLRASPSTFASTLCVIADTDKPRQIADVSARLAMPYAGLTTPTTEDPFTGPSPDDVVLRAQKRGPTKPKNPKKSTGNKLAESVDKLAVDDSPRVKSKNLNVVEEFTKSGMKRMANFVVIGHVDHGKSTLMGRLLYDLKVIDQRSVDKLRKEAENIGKSSFALAWVMDQTSEERSRGVTVDIATNHFETDNTRFTILDAPGHKDFIPNMIAGASQADFAVLVIDASVNSFESGLKGQTKEHALLVRSLGVQRLIVAVNKMDTVAWLQQRFDEITQAMTAFLTSASFSAKTITFIPCAGLTGDNVTKRVEDPHAAWYTGDTLVQALDSTEPAKRAIEKPLRMTIGDVFRGGVINPVSISGRIDAGSVQVGDTLLAMPSDERAIVKAIELEQEAVDWAVAGQIPTLHLADIDPIHLKLGDIVCDPRSPIVLVKAFKCKILAFDHVLPMSIDVFRGRLQAEGKITSLAATLNKTSGEVIKKKPRIVKPAEVARVVVELEKELPLEAGVRVVLREGGNTVAAGLIE